MTPMIYLISGLGADKRVFDSLNLSGYEYQHLEWIPPNKNESIECYATRLSKHITTPHPILIGVSFGGIMAIELSKQIDTSFVVLISSSRRQGDIPFFLRLLAKFRIHHLVPAALLQTANPLTYWLFGTRTDHQKALLGDIIKKADSGFLKWAINETLFWKNNVAPNNLVTIHGSKDRILPSRNPDFEIMGGGHLMIIDKHKEITAIIRGILKKFQAN